MTEVGITKGYPERLVSDASRTPHRWPAILDALHSLDINSEDYLLIGGASLVVRGVLDDTPDIDMLVSGKGFRTLADRLTATLHNPPLSAIARGATNMSVHLYSNGVPVTAAEHMGDGYYPISFTEHRPKAEFFEGVPCMDIEDVISSKTALARENDVSHLTDIASYVGRELVIPYVSSSPPPSSTPPYYDF